MKKFNFETFNNDIVEEDFFKIFKPMYIILCMTGAAKINYRYKFVCETSILQRLYANFLIALTATTFTTSLRKAVIYNIDPINWRPMDGFSYLNIIQLFSTNFTYILLILNNTYCNREKNIQIYIVLQNIDRVLKIKEKSKHYKELFNYNRKICLLLLFFYFLWFLLAYKGFTITVKASFNFFTFYHTIVIIIFFMSLIVEDFEMVMFVSFLRFIQFRIKFVNDALVEILKSDDNFISMKSLELKDYWNIYTAYRGIARAFNLTHNISRFYVSDIFK